MPPREPSANSRTISLPASAVPTKTSQSIFGTICCPRPNYPSTYCRDCASTPTYWLGHNCMAHLTSTTLLLLPLAFKSSCNEKPTAQCMWAPHGSAGWYLRPALKSYQCYMVWIMETQAQHICDTLTWLPIKVPMSTASSIDLVLSRIQDINTALQNPSANSLLAPLTDSQGAALQQLMVILCSTTTNMTPPPVLAATVSALRVPFSIPVPAIPLRVPLATVTAIPLRVLLATVNAIPLRVTPSAPLDMAVNHGNNPIPESPHLIPDDHMVVLSTNARVPVTDPSMPTLPDGIHIIPNEHDNATTPTSNCSTKCKI